MSGCGKPRHLGGLPRHERVRLHVEDEIRRRALGPQRRDRALGKRVVGRVHLDGGELARVVAESFLARRHAARIEHIPLRDRRIGPRCRADPDLAPDASDLKSAGRAGRPGSRRARGRRAPTRRRTPRRARRRDRVRPGAASRFGACGEPGFSASSRPAADQRTRLASPTGTRTGSAARRADRGCALREQPSDEPLPLRDALHLDRDRIDRLLDPLQPLGRLRRGRAARSSSASRASRTAARSRARWAT